MDGRRGRIFRIGLHVLVAAAIGVLGLVATYVLRQFYPRSGSVWMLVVVGPVAYLLSALRDRTGVSKRGRLIAGLFTVVVGVIVFVSIVDRSTAVAVIALLIAGAGAVVAGLSGRGLIKERRQE